MWPATILQFRKILFSLSTDRIFTLVNYSRAGSPPHGRVAGPYDVVYGPVSLWQQQLVIKDCDQVSFHTDNALGILPKPQLHAQGKLYF